MYDPPDDLRQAMEIACLNALPFPFPATANGKELPIIIEKIEVSSELEGSMFPPSSSTFGYPQRVQTWTIHGRVA